MLLETQIPMKGQLLMKLIPFIIIIFTCQLSGQDDPGANNDAKLVKRRGPRFCKKFGCPVRIIIREAIFFPEYKVSAIIHCLAAV